MPSSRTSPDMWADAATALAPAHVRASRQNPGSRRRITFVCSYGESVSWHSRATPSRPQSVGSWRKALPYGWNRRICSSARRSNVRRSSSGELQAPSADNVQNATGTRVTRTRWTCVNCTHMSISGVQAWSDRINLTSRAVRHTDASASKAAESPMSILSMMERPGIPSLSGSEWPKSPPSGMKATPGWLDCATEVKWLASIGANSCVSSCRRAKAVYLRPSKRSAACTMSAQA
mmetsp:Transcript_42172/g.111020  ORF Transcript_42172/g.111020 Transcript_42172/m.111020 type:complete len:234 (+) Transcript_42172:349-1050(+)